MNTKKTTLQKGNGKYEEFLKGLRLIYVGLEKCSAKLDRSGLYALWETKTKIARDFSDDYEVTRVEEGYFEALGLFTVTLMGSDADSNVLTVECEFKAHLHGTKPLHRPFVERFVSSDLQLILVPYARQFISSITGGMSIPPVFIPLSAKPSGQKQKKRSHGKIRDNPNLTEEE